MPPKPHSNPCHSPRDTSFQPSHPNRNATTLYNHNAFWKIPKITNTRPPQLLQMLQTTSPQLLWPSQPEFTPHSPLSYHNRCLCSEHFGLSFNVPVNKYALESVQHCLDSSGAPLNHDTHLVPSTCPETRTPCTLEFHHLAELGENEAIFDFRASQGQGWF